MSLPSRFRVLVRDPARPARPGRDLLHADDDVHGGRILPATWPGQIDGRTRSCRRVPTRRLPAGRAAAAHRQLLGVVGDGPRPGRDPARRCRPTTTSRWPRRTGAATPPASPRAPRPTASTSSSCSAATARSTRRPTAWPAPTRRSPPLPGGSTNVFARTIGLPNDPIEATGALLDARSPAVASSAVGLGSVNGRYFLFHVGHRASTPRSCARSSGGHRSSATPATRCSCARRSTPGCATTTEPPPLRRAPRRRHRRRRRPTSPSPSTRTRTRSWEAARSTSRRHDVGSAAEHRGGRDLRFVGSCSCRSRCCAAPNALPRSRRQVRSQTSRHAPS